jgi:hypothetical protein
MRSSTTAGDATNLSDDVRAIHDLALENARPAECPVELPIVLEHVEVREAVFATDLACASAHEHVRAIGGRVLVHLDAHLKPRAVKARVGVASAARHWLITSLGPNARDTEYSRPEQHRDREVAHDPDWQRYPIGAAGLVPSRVAVLARIRAGDITA